MSETPAKTRAPRKPRVTKSTPAPVLAGPPAVRHPRTGRVMGLTDARHPEVEPQVEFYCTVFRAAVKKAGLPAGTTSHDLRHHYASVLLAGGDSVLAVAERLGHEDATLVMTTYGHLLPDSKDRTRQAVDAAWRAMDVPSTGSDEGLIGP